MAETYSTDQGHQTQEQPDEGKNAKSYFLQACATVFIGVLAMAVYGYTVDKLSDTCSQSVLSDSQERACNAAKLLVAGSFFIVLGGGFGILTYCCKEKLPGILKFIAAAILWLGGLLFLAGECTPIDDANGYFALVLGYAKLGIGLFLMTCVIAAQMTTDWLNSERARIIATSLAIGTFAVASLCYFGTLALGNGLEEEVRIAGSSGSIAIMFSALWLTVLLFALHDNPARMLRFVVAALLAASVVVFLGAYAKVASDITDLNLEPSDENVAKLQTLLPAFFAMCEIAILCLDILF